MFQKKMKLSPPVTLASYSEDLQIVKIYALFAMINILVKVIHIKRSVLDSTKWCMATSV